MCLSAVQGVHALVRVMSGNVPQSRSEKKGCRSRDAADPRSSGWKASNLCTRSVFSGSGRGDACAGAGQGVCVKVI